MSIQAKYKSPKYKPTPAPLKKGVIVDPIHPTDFLNLTITYYCEMCTHFDVQNKACTIGYDAEKHMKAAQDYRYNLSGKVAFCRFIEID